jgi:hypothetical protein
MIVAFSADGRNRNAEAVVVGLKPRLAAHPRPRVLCVVVFRTPFTAGAFLVVLVEAGRTWRTERRARLVTEGANEARLTAAHCACNSRFRVLGF